jgi:hypothetical protein
MTYKICQTIFSTNRIPYLQKTLESQRLIDTTGCEITKIFFDDYPKDRNDRYLEIVVKTHGYNNVVLHTENQGISKTWQELFNYIKTQDYDYIWHQEDDAEILHPFRLVDFIHILENNKQFSQIQLKRNNWYDFETEPIGPKDNDIIFNNYRIEHGNPYFWMMSSLYPAWIAKEFNHTIHNGYPSEASIANFLLQKNGSSVALVKTMRGEHMVNHFGEYTRGTRLAKGDLGWEAFVNYDPNLNYDSKSGQLYTEK